MVQVTMTGPEYAELLEKERQLEELVALFKADRQYSIPEDSLSSYSTGTFTSSFEFPAWLQKALLKDMEHQLCMMEDDEFVKLVKSGHSYYHTLDKVFRADLYSGSRGYTDMRQFSKAVNERWEKIQKRLDAGEIIGEVNL